MRIPTRLLIGVLALFSLLACARQAPPPAPAGPRVTVVLHCPQDLESPAAGGATANPFQVVAARDDEVTWVLQPAGGGTANRSFTISSNDWPFPDPSYDGNDSISVTVPSDAAANTYKYTIEMECNGQPVVLDPGMRIG